MKDYCNWTLEDIESNTYETDCGQLWFFSVGTPSENKCKFCHYCGKPIKEDLSLLEKGVKEYE